MEKSEVIRLLQQYRHDLMNRMQLVHGYLTMKKYEKVDEKIEDLFQYFQEERKLMNTKAPSFILWMMYFPLRYKQFQLEYHVDTDHDLSEMDESIVSECTYLMDNLLTICNKDNLYEMKIDVIEEEQKIEFNFLVNGQFNRKIENNKQTKNSNPNFLLQEDGLIYRFMLPRNG
ncbi:Spo0B domain-containing protein [Oceanobacillus piezotolerans]|nr:Spo0B domain-containing protein [Oceanobacillus piezotolerans]